MRTLILSTILKVITPLFLGIAIYMFFRGHDKPGGGFIAGLIASIPFMLHAMVFGYKKTKSTFNIRSKLLAAIGLLVSFLSGMFSVFRSEPFMSPIWMDKKLPLIGKIGTPIFFDIGVFFVVFGVVLHITFLLTEE